jgi:hypothetical protein
MSPRITSSLTGLGVRCVMPLLLIDESARVTEKLRIDRPLGTSNVLEAVLLAPAL